MNDLIECKTCKQSIACLAASCPGCGAPNDWQHPDVVQFLTVKDNTGISKPFNFAITKTTISGQTPAKVPAWAWVIALLLLGFAAIINMVAGIFWSVMVGVGVAFLLHATKRAESFHADLENKTWSSSNEEFWMPVRKALKL